MWGTWGTMTARPCGADSGRSARGGTGDGGLRAGRGAAGPTGRARRPAGAAIADRAEPTTKWLLRARGCDPARSGDDTRGSARPRRRTRRRRRVSRPPRSSPIARRAATRRALGAPARRSRRACASPRARRISSSSIDLRTSSRSVADLARKRREAAVARVRLASERIGVRAHLARATRFTSLRVAAVLMSSQAAGDGAHLGVDRLSHALEQPIEFGTVEGAV